MKTTQFSPDTVQVECSNTKSKSSTVDSTPKAAAKPRKKPWPYPVSKAFYEKIRERGGKIMDELGYGAGWMKYLMPHIEQYMLTGVKLGDHYAYECMKIVFTCLRYDVDIAMERSAKAKARAAEKAALKAEKAANEDEKAALKAEKAANEAVNEVMTVKETMEKSSLVNETKSLEPAMAVEADNETEEVEMQTDSVMENGDEEPAGKRGGAVRPGLMLADFLQRGMMEIPRTIWWGGGIEQREHDGKSVSCGHLKGRSGTVPRTSPLRSDVRGYE